MRASPACQCVWRRVIRRRWLDQSAELVGMVSVAVHAVPDSLLFPFPLRMIQRLQPQCPRGMSGVARCSSNCEVLAMTTPCPRECEISRYRHGSDPPRMAKAVSPSDCQSLDIVRTPAATSSASTQSPSINTVTAITLSLSLSIFVHRRKLGMEKGDLS